MVSGHSSGKRKTSRFLLCSPGRLCSPLLRWRFPPPWRNADRLRRRCGKAKHALTSQPTRQTSVCGFGTSGDDELWVTEKWRELFGFAKSEPVNFGQLPQVRAPRGSRTYEATCAAHVRARGRRPRKRISHHAAGRKHALDRGLCRRRVRRTWQTGLRARGVARHHRAQNSGGRVARDEAAYGARGECRQTRHVDVGHCA